ncbi:hypothetical protein LFZ31_11680, partial [Salmonella enterica subsp. enterica serovar Newport str. S09097]
MPTICTRPAGTPPEVSNAATSAARFSDSTRLDGEFSRMNGLAVSMTRYSDCAAHAGDFPRRFVNHWPDCVTHRFLSRHKHGVATEDHPTVLVIFVHGQQA